MKPIAPAPPPTLPGRPDRGLPGRETLALLLVFFVQLILISPALMPALIDVSPDDEAKYVQSGWLLLHGEPRDLAWGPLVALVYAPLHLLVGNSPDWFLLEVWLGRFLLFAWLWFGVLSLARQLRAHAPPLVMAGILFVSPLFLRIIENQSDAVFIGMSVLALSRVIAFTRSGRLRDALLASALVGLGVLARVEALALLPVLMVILAVVNHRRAPELPAWRVLLASAVPALALVGLYLGASLWITGTTNAGLSGKSYDSFEMNQPAPAGGEAAARAESIRLFGTSQQNNGSVLRAVLRNPGAFLWRILVNVTKLPDYFLLFFGKTQGLVAALLAAWGLYVLVRARAWLFLALLFAWALPAAVSLGFYMRHLVPQTVYVPLILAAVGAAALFSPGRKNFERLALLLVSVGAALAGWAAAKPGFLLAGMLLAAALGLAWLVGARELSAGRRAEAVLLLLLVVGLLLRERFPFPNYPVLGQSVDEQTVRILEANLPPRANVLAPNGLPVLAARMNIVEASALPSGLADAPALWQWLRGRQVQAVVLDQRFNRDKALPGLLAAGAGRYFDSAYAAPKDVIRVYLVKKPACQCP